MATGVVIRLRNLPLVAGTVDIRGFFNGLRIPDGGVHIIGGEDGTAFILFLTDEDARQAMMRDGQMVAGMPIKLMLSSHSEMKGVIDDSQRVCEELRGLRPPEPPITNLSNHSSAIGRSDYPSTQSRQFHAKPPSPGIMPPMAASSDMHLEVKGMPFDVDDNALMYFFAPIPLLSIRFMVDEMGRRTGDALVKFKSPMDLYEAMKKDRTYFGSRYIKLNPVADRQPQMPVASIYDPIRAMDRKRPLSPNEGTPKRSREFSPLRSDNCVEIRGLPPSANYKSIGEFFTRLRFTDGSLYIEGDGKACKGRAFVEFITYADFKEALLKDGDMLNGKQVRVISLSKQNMLEQVRNHKKYIKGKREEEAMREKERKLQEKKMKDDRKREYQMRKQKEMDEWLRRQHQKEEEERKRRDYEKQMILKSMEDQRHLEVEAQLAKKKQQLAEQIKLIEKRSSPPSASDGLNKKVEPVSGAGEMEIEDVPQEPVSSAPLPKTDVVASVAMPAPPVFGASGGIVGPAGMPFIVQPGEFPMPPMPPIPGMLLPPSLPPITATEHGPPALPGFPPPPLPNALPLPPAPPMMEEKKELVVPNVSHQQPSNGEITGGAGTGSPSGSVFVRMANTPFKITEDDVRRFLSDVSIPPNGIQFVNKKRMRSGHVFIKCTSEEDAKRAASKNDQPLLGRNVLVQLSSVGTFEEIYFKLNRSKYVASFDKVNPNKGNGQGNTITKRIKEENLTCICVGNLPWDTSSVDVLRAFDSLHVVKPSLHVVKGLDGKCKGEAFLEMETSDECAKAADMHGVLEIRGNSVRILPLSRFNMRRDIEVLDKKISAEISSHVSDSHPMPGLPPRGAPGPMQMEPPRLPPMPHGRPEPPLPPPDDRMLFPRDIPPMMPPRDLPPMFDPRDLPPDAGRFSSIPMMPGMPKDGLPPLPFDGRLPPMPHPDFMRPRTPPTPEELLRLRGPPIPFDSNLPPFRFPPPNHPRFPMSVSSMPLNPANFVSVKMGNLNFKVTQEDILEFFWAFEPIPDSVRLMYSKNGKPTGDGIIAFRNIDAARAALDHRNGKELRQQPIRLYLQ